MPWTTPTDRTTGYTVTAADWNIVEDDLLYLYGDTGWTTISTFSGTWTAVAGTGVGYIRTGNVVSLRGMIQSGTINTAAFTLPVGYRPSTQLNFGTVANGAFGSIVISGAGVFTPATGATTNFSIACTFNVIF